MKATTSTALALLLGLGLALPAAAGQPGAGTDGDRYATAEEAAARGGQGFLESAGGLVLPAAAGQPGAGTDGDRYVTAGEAVTRAEQRFLELAGGEEDMQDPSFTNAATGPRNAEAAAWQEVPRQTEPAIEGQDEQLQAQQQPAPGGAGAEQGQTAVRGVVAPGARTEALEIALTEETLQATYFTDADWVGLEGNNLALSLLLSDDRDIVGSAAVMAPGLLGNALPEALSVSFGGKAYAALLDEPDDDVFALAPGVEGRLALPAVLGTPSFVVGNIFYSPDILTFGEAEDVVDFNVRYELQFTQRLLGFVGYRLLAFDRDEGEDDVVEGLQAGVRFAF